MFKWLMLLLYALLSYYILWRGIHWLKIVFPVFKYKRLKAAVIFVYLTFASTIFFGAFLPENEVKVGLSRIGNVWIGFFILFLFFLLAADILVMVLKLVNRKREVTILKKKRGAWLIGTGVLAGTLFFTVYGSIHAYKIHTSHYEISVEKEVEGKRDFRVVLVADMHLSYGIGCRQMETMVEKINQENPDLVVFAGDIFNNNYDALDDPERLKEIFRSIRSSEGVYAVWGNHDIQEILVGGFSTASKKFAFRDERMDALLKESGIKVLMDETTTVLDGKIQLIGRLDEEKPGDGTTKRLPLEELVSGLDMEKPVFLIDHEPKHLSEAAAKGVDVMLSGHTHAGQFFPLTLMNFFAWENPCGLLKVDNMYSLVTSGTGFYGPALRIGTDAEIMSVKIHFSDAQTLSGR